MLEMRTPLKDLLDLVNMAGIPLGQEKVELAKNLLTKCSFADSEVDYNNKVQVFGLFQSKKINRMSQYIKELIALDNNLRKDKKLQKKLFSDISEYNKFMAANSEWILDKSQYEFTKDEIHGMLLYLSKNAQYIVQGNKDLPQKFDNLLKKFITDQSVRKESKDLNLAQYKGIFE